MKIRTKVFLMFFILTFSLSLLICYIFYADASKTKSVDLRNTITSIASSATLLIDAQKHSYLKEPEDMISAEYLEISQKLRLFRNDYPQIKNIYTMVKTEKPNVWKFVVDASEEKDEDGDGKIGENEKNSLPGEEYDVSRYPEMQKAFDGPIADKVITYDKWGAWLSGYAPIYDSGHRAVAILGVDVSAKTIQEEQNKLLKRILMIFFAAGLLSLIMSIILSNSITMPILKVINTAKAVSEGKYETEIGDKRNDEIGELIISINDMSKNIKKTISKLTTLNRTGEILTLTIDLQESLRVAINLSLEILGASKGVILLYNKEENMFILGTTSGFASVKIIDDELFVGMNKFSLKPDKNFVDYITDKPDIYSIEEVENIPQLRQLLGWIRATGSRMLIPFIIKQDLRGIIMLDTVTSDKEFLKTLINQISLSIENARLYHEAIIDGLTKLYVHRYFEIQLTTEIKRCQRFDKKLSVLMIDIDNFKSFNDTYGHQAGDFVLKEVSNLIKNATRAIDTVSRYGGEEISVMLPETEIEGAMTIAEKIRLLIDTNIFHYQKNKLRVTISIGVAEWDKDLQHTYETLMSAADEELYKAKREGKNRVCARSKSEN